MTEAIKNNRAIELVEKIKQGCDGYRELCILGKDEEGTRLKEEILDKDIEVLDGLYQSLSDANKRIVDKRVAEAYQHLMDAGRVMTGQIKGLARRLEE